MLRRLLTIIAGAVLLVTLATSGAGAETTHTVADGETLSHIAVRNGVTVRSIVKANGLANPDRIRVGQRLIIPSKSNTTAKPSPVASGRTYTIVSGDSLSQIAIDLGVRSKDLASLNGISNPNRIRAGQVLKVPGGSVSTSAGTPGPVLDTASYGHYSSLPRAVAKSPERRAMIAYFEKWAQANGISADLLMAIAWHESGWQPGVVSYKGAVGIGQLMPEVSDWIARDLIGRPGLDPYDAEDNIRMSARYVRWLIGYMGSEDLAVAAYYQGPGSVKGGPLYGVTEQYTASVKAHRPLFRADQ